MSEPKQYTLTADDEDVGARLDVWLSERLPEHSRSEIKRAIKAGQVLVDGAPPNKAGMPLVGSETVTMTVAAQVIAVPEPEDLPLDVIYEDEHLLVINKAAGMVVHPAPGTPNGTVVNAVMHRCPDITSVGDAQRPGIVHRLDKGTTGLMVVAKTAEAHRKLGEVLRAREVKRGYDALAWGVRWQASGTIDAPIGRDPHNRLRMAVVKSGRPSVTHWELVGQNAPTARLRLSLETGRTHQIRVHLAHQNHSILGDEMYGGMEKGWLQRLHDIRPKAAAQVKRVGRPMLHARTLSFAHPATGEWLSFETEVPEDFAKVVALALD